jgi:hypothetical protein
MAVLAAPDMECDQQMPAVTEWCLGDWPEFRLSLSDGVRRTALR